MTAVFVSVVLALAALAGFSHVSGVSARIPVLSAVSAANRAVRLVFARRAAHPQPQTAAQPAPAPAAPPAVPNQSTNPVPLAPASVAPPVSVPANPVQPSVPTAGVTEASVTILTDPAGANVQVDTTPVGTTPVTLTNIAPGPHQVRIFRVGYLPVSRTVKLERGEAVTLSLNLSPIGRTAHRQPRQGAATPLQPSRKALEVGTRAPSFVLKDRLGVLYRLHDMLGRRVAILFVWNLDTQARAAIKDLDLRTRRAEGHYSPLVVILTPDRVSIRGFVTGDRIGVPVLFGNDHAAEMYGVARGVPVFYVLSEQGTITHRQTGTIQLASILP